MSVYKKFLEIVRYHIEYQLDGIPRSPLCLNKKLALRLLIVCGVFALGFFFYFVYLLIHARLLAAGLTLIPTILISLVARYVYREYKIKMIAGAS